jgi:hypothetical protein
MIEQMIELQSMVGDLRVRVAQLEAAPADRKEREMNDNHIADADAVSRAQFNAWFERDFARDETGRLIGYHESTVHELMLRAYRAALAAPRADADTAGAKLNLQNVFNELREDFSVADSGKALKAVERAIAAGASNERADCGETLPGEFKNAEDLISAMRADADAVGAKPANWSDTSAEQRNQATPNFVGFQGVHGGLYHSEDAAASESEFGICWPLVRYEKAND